jgi:hypothetical protein
MPSSVFYPDHTVPVFTQHPKGAFVRELNASGYPLYRTFAVIVLYFFFWWIHAGAVQITY